MASSDIYLDNNATTFLLPEVRHAMNAALNMDLGNPSSAHNAGHTARVLLRRARGHVAGLMKVEPEQIVFTSGGTEANVAVLLSLLRQTPKRRLVTTTIEHSSIIQSAKLLETEGVEVVWLSPSTDGEINPAEVEHVLRDGENSFVSIQWVNNETGVLQDIEAMSRVCHSYGALLHTDAAQALGKIPLQNISDTDFVTVTAHKLHGPKGVGALWVKNPGSISPLLQGGAQEKSIRPGTENLLGVVGFGTAAENRLKNLDNIMKRLRILRDRFETEIKTALPWIKINGIGAQRVCNTTNIRFCGIDGQGLMAQLDGQGIYCSQSSACNNARLEPSHVLRAMGLTEEEAYESVRFSFSELNNDAEIDRAVESITAISVKLRNIGGVNKAFGEA